jgi:hypothetical protein
MIANGLFWFQFAQFMKFADRFFIREIRLVVAESVVSTEQPGIHPVSGRQRFVPPLWLSAAVDGRRSESSASKARANRFRKSSPSRWSRVRSPGMFLERRGLLNPVAFISSERVSRQKCGPVLRRIRSGCSVASPLHLFLQGLPQEF